jgi:hypothetical protein
MTDINRIDIHKYKLIMNIIDLIKKNNRNDKIKLIENDRIALKIDRLIQSDNNLVKHLKCGKIQTNFNEFIESLENVALDIIDQLEILIEYDRKISTISSIL